MKRTHRNWNRIPKQKELVENGKTGDCWRCCIAAILGLPARKVPHFLANAIRKKRSMDCLTQEWLNKRGLFLALVKRGDIVFPRYWTKEPDKTEWPPIISCGPTPRSKQIGDHHATVTIHGKLVYDPHPSNAGLTAITDQYMIVSTKF
jgi:hypothetical protein